MTLKYSTTVNTGRLNAIEANATASPTLRIFSGTEPAIGTVISGPVLLAAIALPADWLGAPSGVAPNLKVDKVGTWSVTAVGAGTASFFRIGPTAGGDTQAGHVQGSCGQGTGDMSFDNATIAIGQTVTVNTFSITAGNQA